MGYSISQQIPGPSHMPCVQGSICVTKSGLARAGLQSNVKSSPVFSQLVL